MWSRTDIGRTNRVRFADVQDVKLQAVFHRPVICEDVVSSKENKSVLVFLTLQVVTFFTFELKYFKEIVCVCRSLTEAVIKMGQQGAAATHCILCSLELILKLLLKNMEEPVVKFSRIYNSISGTDAVFFSKLERLSNVIVSF